MSRCPHGALGLLTLMDQKTRQAVWRKQGGGRGAGWMMEPPHPFQQPTAASLRASLVLTFIINPFQQEGSCTSSCRHWTCVCLPVPRLGAASKEPAEGFSPYKPLLKTLELPVILESYQELVHLGGCTAVIVNISK